MDVDHFSVGVLSAEPEIRDSIGKAWGKKGSKTDISLYSVAKPYVQTTVTPETYPAKPLSLVTAAHMSDVVVWAIPISGVDVHVGETAILADTLGIPGVRALIGENASAYVGVHGQVDKMFAEMIVTKYPKISVDYSGLGDLRDSVIEVVKSSQTHRGSASDPLAVMVDHAFPVQGVGSVILGTVKSGTIKKGEKIWVYPGGFQGVVKSIQVNDVDEREAGPGTHVGVALRGVLDKNLQRGSVITNLPDSIEDVSESKLDLQFAKFGERPEVGSKLHVVTGLLDVSAEVLETGSSFLQLHFQKPIPFVKYSPCTVLDLNAKQRIVGSCWI